MSKSRPRHSKAKRKQVARANKKDATPPRNGSQVHDLTEGEQAKAKPKYTNTPAHLKSAG